MSPLAAGQSVEEGKATHPRCQRLSAAATTWAPVATAATSTAANSPAGRPRCTLDSLGDRRRVGVITVLDKAQVQHTPHLAALRASWRGSQHTTRAAVANDLLLEISRTPTTRCQRAFTSATTHVWNAFTGEVGVRAMDTQQGKVAPHAWCRMLATFKRYV